MNQAIPVFHFDQAMRWYGPQDTVDLWHLRQAGCTHVVTALHQIPVGEVWSVAAIEERQNLCQAAGLTWSVVESLPVSEDIKRRSGQYQQHITNYQQSILNLAACGIHTITYNFMPVLDWLRTDIAYPMPDRSLALRFEKLAFHAFDLLMLKRPNAQADYSPEEQQQALVYYNRLSSAQREKLFNNCLLGLPGSDIGFTPQEVLTALAKYASIGHEQLQANLFHFLEQVVPTAAQVNSLLAIHPDDPPFPLLGLPRVVSTEPQIAALLEAVPHPANGLCFCTGSLGARPDNDVAQMAERFGDRIHFVHLRNTARDAAGNFVEADHLEGDTDLVGIVYTLVSLMQRRQKNLPMRPDHGHQMLDDLNKQTYPGYSAIGRLRGLAELRGVEAAILRRIGL